jgi:hypothetical protein
MDGSEGEHLDTGRFGDGLDDEWLGCMLGFFFVGLITLFVYDSEAGLVSWVLVNPV